jgi:cytosine/adenosine deaminase-related metal-dependent hydrolase
MSQTTVLVGGAVVTVDETRRVLDPGAVAIEGDRIAAVGPREEVLEDHRDAETVDLQHTVLLPGLVDSHGHAGHALTKDVADGTGEWLDAVAELYFRASGRSFWEAESRLAALERLQAGVTTSLSYTGSMPRVDDPKFAEAAASGYREYGLRHVVAVGPPNAPLPRRCYDPETETETLVDLDRAMATTEAVVDRLHGSADGRLSVAVAPSSLVPERDDDGAATAFSVEQLERVVALADDRDLSMQAHAYAGEVAAAAAAVPEALSDRLSLAHCAGIDEREIELMAEHDVSASHGPLTHAYASARFPVVEAMEAGVNVAVSTDGAAPDRSFDLLAQGRIAAQLQRAHFGDTSLLPAGTVLETMTIDAAEALGLEDEVGSLEPGKRADVVAVDLDAAKLAPRVQHVPRLVNYADGSDVEFVAVDGETLVADGELQVDVVVDEVLADADRELRAAVERAGFESYLDSHPDLWGAVRYRR